jgi:hypothetical protein
MELKDTWDKKESGLPDSLMSFLSFVSLSLAEDCRLQITQIGFLHRPHDDLA